MPLFDGHEELLEEFLGYLSGLPPSRQEDDVYETVVLSDSCDVEEVACVVCCFCCRVCSMALSDVNHHCYLTCVNWFPQYGETSLICTSDIQLPHLLQ